MTTDQLALFEPDTEPARPVTFVQVCQICGDPVSAIKLDDVSEPWLPPVLWSYVAQKAHEREVHPELTS